MTNQKSLINWPKFNYLPVSSTNIYCYADKDQKLSLVLWDTAEVEFIKLIGCACRKNSYINQMAPSFKEGTMCGRLKQILKSRCITILCGSNGEDNYLPAKDSKGYSKEMTFIQQWRGAGVLLTVWKIWKGLEE